MHGMCRDEHYMYHRIEVEMHTCTYGIKLSVRHHQIHSYTYGAWIKGRRSFKDGLEIWLNANAIFLILKVTEISFIEGIIALLSFEILKQQTM